MTDHDRRTETDAERKARLDAALDKGKLEQLPPNQPKGLLGDRGFDYYKTDDLTPDMNAGVSQEIDPPNYFLLVLLGYLLFFPVGFWLLWRAHSFSLRAKIGWSIAFAAGVLWVAYRVWG